MNKTLKKTLTIALAMFMIFSFSACSEFDPRDLKMDVYRGTDTESKLLHIVSNTQEKIDQMNGIREAISVDNAVPTDKAMDLLGYYPDYRIEVYPRGEESFTAIVDISYDRVEFYYPGPNPEESDTIYLSNVSAEDFMILINSV